VSEPWIGIDIGGTGIKAGLVDPERGELVSERIKVATPHPATPESVVAATMEACARFESTRPIGIGLPAAIVHGRAVLATHLDKAWIGMHVVDAFTEALGRPATVLNDADCAGLAEMRFGAGAGEMGVVLLLTLGTGIGSALFIDGVLVPNTELGHIEVRGKSGEARAAASVRERESLDWKEWVEDRLNEYLQRVDGLIWPDLMILGGGVSRHAQHWAHYLDVRPPVVAATLENDAGIVGAAMRAVELFGRGASGE
jgi:polyphosphate glucokinase